MFSECYPNVYPKDVAVGSISLFALKTFENILHYVMFIDSLSLAGAAAALFFIRRKQKDQEYKGF